MGEKGRGSRRSYARSFRVDSLTAVLIFFAHLANKVKPGWSSEPAPATSCSSLDTESTTQMLARQTSFQINRDFVWTTSSAFVRRDWRRLSSLRTAGKGESPEPVA